MKMKVYYQRSLGMEDLTRFDSPLFLRRRGSAASIEKHDRRTHVRFQ